MYMCVCVQQANVFRAARLSTSLRRARKAARQSAAFHVEAARWKAAAVRGEARRRPTVAR